MCYRTVVTFQFRNVLSTGEDHKKNESHPCYDIWEHIKNGETHNLACNEGLLNILYFSMTMFMSRVSGVLGSTVTNKVTRAC
jgi:hypothetical protein